MNDKMPRSMSVFALNPVAANFKRVKSKKWAERAKPIIGYGGADKCLNNNYNNEKKIQREKGLRRLDQAAQVPENLELLSNTVNYKKYCELPALPEVNTHDASRNIIRSRSNSFEYHDDLHYFSSYSLKNHQLSAPAPAPAPPPPPPKTNAPPTSFSQILGAQLDRDTCKYLLSPATTSPHPESLVPGRVKRTDATNTTGVLFLSTESRRNPMVGEFPRRKDHFRPTVPSSSSSRVSPRSNSLIQKTNPVSKSFSHPRAPRDKPCLQVMADSPTSAAGRNPNVNSVSDKPLPFVPPAELYQNFENKRNDKIEVHAMDEPRIRDSIDLEKLSTHSIDRNELDDSERKSTHSSSSESISQKNFESPTTFVISELPSPRLPDLSRVSVFSADIFSQINTEEQFNFLKDNRSTSTVLPELNSVTQARGNFRPNSNFSASVGPVENYIFDRAPEHDSLAQNESKKDRTDNSSISMINLGPITGRNSSLSEVESPKLGLNSYSEASPPHSPCRRSYIEDDHMTLDFKKQDEDIPYSCTEKIVEPEFSSLDNSSTLAPNLVNIPKDVSNKNSSTHSVCSTHITSTKSADETLIQLIQLHPSLPDSSPVGSHILCQKNMDSYESFSKRQVILDNGSQDGTQFSPNLKPSRRAITRKPSKLDLRKDTIEIENNLNDETVGGAQSSTRETTETLNSKALTLNSVSTSILAVDSSTSTVPAEHTGIFNVSQSVNHSASNSFTKADDSMFTHTETQITLDSELDAFGDESEKLQHEIFKSLKSEPYDEKIDQKLILDLSTMHHDVESPYLPARCNTKSFSEENKFIPLSEDEKDFVAPLSPRPPYDFASTTQLSNQSRISKEFKTIDIPSTYSLFPETTLNFSKALDCSVDSLVLFEKPNFGTETGGKDRSSLDSITVRDSTIGCSSHLNKTPGLENTTINDSSVSKKCDESEKEANLTNIAHQETSDSRPLSWPSHRDSLSSHSITLSPQITESHAISPNQKFTATNGLHNNLLSQNLFNITPPTNSIGADKIPTFSEILSLKTPKQRIQTFNNTREIFYATDVGLEVWIRRLKNRVPQYENITASFDGIQSSPILTNELRFAQENTGIIQGFQSLNQQSCNQNHQDISLSTSPSSPKPRHTPATVISSSQYYPSMGNKLKSQQVQARGKELIHTAGVLSGKAGKAGKDLLAKGKSRLRANGGEKTRLGDTKNIKTNMDPETTDYDMSSRRKPPNNGLRNSLVDSIKEQSQKPDL